MKYKIRDLKREDAEQFEYAFARQGSTKPAAQFVAAFGEQQRGLRKVFVAEFECDVLGYLILLPSAVSGPFANMRIPEIAELTILNDYQGNGIGSALMDAAELEASRRSDNICLSVGLHTGFGAIQCMCVRRGYIPDGSGLWYQGEPLPENASAINDNHLNLYFIKPLKKLIR